MLGYANPRTGLPHFKPKRFVTDMKAAVEYFGDDRFKCQGHVDAEGNEVAHEHLIGAAQTRAQAAWPDELDEHVAKVASCADALKRFSENYVKLEQATISATKTCRQQHHTIELHLQFENIRKTVCNM